MKAGAFSLFRSVKVFVCCYADFFVSTSDYSLFASALHDDSSTKIIVKQVAAFAPASLSDRYFRLN